MNNSLEVVDIKEFEKVIVIDAKVKLIMLKKSLTK